MLRGRGLGTRSLRLPLCDLRLGRDEPAAREVDAGLAPDAVLVQSLLELEMQAQDKLDSQEESFRKFFEQERAKMIHDYRQKLEQELQTQSEIINERCVSSLLFVRSLLNDILIV